MGDRGAGVGASGPGWKRAGASGSGAVGVGRATLCDEGASAVELPGPLTAPEYRHDHRASAVRPWARQHRNLSEET
ncbi:hypothetical protein ACIRRH_21080 [Kitasatospora sp. NPDC101235]|uniref:hypothetical protein n=1 Tax=Kitasatospora sp. NPDC101235 TaxID=3364101 RepID=UPI0037F26AA2